MDFPRLQNGQHAVVRAEASTGIVLRHDRQWHTGSGEIWQVFESLPAAREFAAAEVSAHPTVECSIYDFEQRHVETVRHEKDKG
jgi:hypothetical protein